MTISSAIPCGEVTFAVERPIITVGICAVGIDLPVHNQAWGDLQTLKWGKFSSIQWGLL